MDKLIIKFRGLKEGQHNYKFKIVDDFFNNFQESEYKKANIDVETKLIVLKDFLTLHVSLKGLIEVQCDRCLEYFPLPISYNTELFVEFGEKNSDISDVDNKIVLSHNVNEIQLDKHLYDYIHLSVPYQKFHPVDKNGNTSCSIEMIEKLKELSSKNNSTTDPRWDKLNELYN